MSTNLATKQRPVVADDLGLVRPSDSALPTEQERARVKALMRKLDAFIRPQDELGGFEKPGGMWDRGVMPAYYECSRKLSECSLNALRYFRFLCITFSGWSVYHNTHSCGQVLPDILAFDEDDADLYWNEATFPEAFRLSHTQLTHKLPPGLIFQPPLRFGEAGWMKDGRFISYDQRHIQERLSLFYQTGLIAWMESKIREQGEVRILEIGGGYGALAFALKNYFPQASYTIVDIPESLRFSGAYMTLTRPDLSVSVGLEPNRYGVRLVPIALAEQLTEEFDLVINTLSMSEMAEKHVEGYCRLMVATWIAKNGYFYEQNVNDTHQGGLAVGPILQRYLEHKVGFAPTSLGAPNIWQSPGANSGTVLNQRPFATNLCKVVDLGPFTISRAAGIYYLLRRDEVLAQAASMEEVFLQLGRLQ